MHSASAAPGQLSRRILMKLLYTKYNRNSMYCLKIFTDSFYSTVLKKNNFTPVILRAAPESIGAREHPSQCTDLFPDEKIPEFWHGGSVLPGENLY